jgi:hypothetical protein
MLISLYAHINYRTMEGAREGMRNRISCSIVHSRLIVQDERRDLSGEHNFTLNSVVKIASLEFSGKGSRLKLGLA